MKIFEPDKDSLANDDAEDTPETLESDQEEVTAEDFNFSRSEETENQPPEDSNPYLDDAASEDQDTETDFIIEDADLAEDTEFTDPSNSAIYLNYPELQDTEPGELLATNRPKSTLSFDELVLEKLARHVIAEIGGISLGSSNSGFFNLKPTSGIGIHVDDNDNVAFDLNIIMEYGQSAPKIREQITDNLAIAVMSATGLIVSEVNIHVANLLSDEDLDN